MRRLAIVLLAASLAIAALPSCDGRTGGRGEPPPRFNGIDERKVFYAIGMHFMGKGYGPWHLITDKDIPYTDIAFVYSGDLAEGYPEDVLVAFPSGTTLRMIENLNWLIEHDGIDLEPYGLEYPVTVEDIVDRWEGVCELVFEGIGRSDYQFIFE